MASYRRRCIILTSGGRRRCFKASLFWLHVSIQLDKEHRSAQHYQQMAEDAKTPLSVAQAEIESLKKELLVAHRHELQLNREVKTSFGEFIITSSVYVSSALQRCVCTGRKYYRWMVSCRRRKLCTRKRCSRRWPVAWRPRRRRPPTS